MAPDHADTQLWIAMAPLYVALVSVLAKLLWQRRRNGSADAASTSLGLGLTKWSRDQALETLQQHGVTLAEHETAIALTQQALTQYVSTMRDGQDQTMRRLDTLASRMHDLNDEMTSVLLKLELPRSRR